MVPVNRYPLTKVPPSDVGEEEPSNECTNEYEPRDGMEFGLGFDVVTALLCPSLRLTLRPKPNAAARSTPACPRLWRTATLSDIMEKSK
jgi:hypothetical protein